MSQEAKIQEAPKAEATADKKRKSKFELPFSTVRGLMRGSDAEHPNMVEREAVEYMINHTVDYIKRLTKAAKDNTIFGQRKKIAVKDLEKAIKDNK